MSKVDIVGPTRLRLTSGEKPNLFFLFFLRIRPPPRSTLFPYTPLFRSTAATGLAGPSAMEPALPGRPGQPPWDLGLHLPPAAAVGLAAVALAAGTAGLGLCLHAIRRGWAVSPRMVLAAGLIAAAVITLAPPFGSSDQLSYAAYGRMVITGHDPYHTTPAMLARLGDPVARAVQDWRGRPPPPGRFAPPPPAAGPAAAGGRHPPSPPS